MYLRFQLLPLTLWLYNYYMIKVFIFYIRKDISMATNRYDVNAHTVEQNNNHSNQCNPNNDAYVANNNNHANQCNPNNPVYHLSRGIMK